ncbi:hypothetical protein ACLOJK_025496 [Asimina triloba]
MELGLSLGDVQKPFPFMEKTIKPNQRPGFCMALGFGSNSPLREEKKANTGERRTTTEDEDTKASSDHPQLQLHLLPPWSAGHGKLAHPHHHGSSISQLLMDFHDMGFDGQAGTSARLLDVNRIPSTEDINGGAAVSSPNSGVSSSPQMEISIYTSGVKRDRDQEYGGIESEAGRASSRASDEDENGMARKKLRLSKEQSAFLEESFKEHNTLNPVISTKQKLALAKQLNLRPRQVEVWFQNRRARTKLKQTEVDCEYLKRCCETLTEENRRLQKELQELRALKSSNPFYTRLPATTLTMCPSCERVVASSNGADSSVSTGGLFRFLNLTGRDLALEPAGRGGVVKSCLRHAVDFQPSIWTGGKLEICMDTGCNSYLLYRLA